MGKRRRKVQSKAPAGQISKPAASIPQTLAGCAAAAVVGLGGGVALALPQGMVVRGGQLVLQQSDANNALIQQGTGRAAADFNSFNIDAGQRVRIQQPGANSTFLGRVTNGQITQIHGQLDANGRVILVNPAGLVVGPGGSVNTAAFTATTLNADPQRFMQSGIVELKALPGSNPNAAVINEGRIAVADGGFAALVAPHVVNNGVITARLGQVQLASGTAATLDISGDGLLSVALDPTVAGSITNNGTIQASYVRLGGGDAAALAAATVSLGGVVEARSNADALGIAVQTSGTVTVSGRLDASAESSGQRGGRISIEGNQINVRDGAVLDARGAAGGGTILVGGSWQNSDPSVQQAMSTTIEPGALLDASATQSGNGGTIVAWSDIRNPNSLTSVGGTLRAEGGPQGGDGGRIETSGYGLRVDGIRVSTLAPLGETGLWLLDPTDITISSKANSNATFSSGNYSVTTGVANIQASDIVNNLLGSNVTLTTATTGSTQSNAGNITVEAAIVSTSASSLTLLADNDIVVNKNISVGGKLTLTASNNISINEAIATGGGNLLLTSTTGNVSSVAAGTISTTAGLNTGSGSGALVVNAGNAINLQAAVSTNSSDNNAGSAGVAGNITFNAKSITVSQPITAIGGSNTSNTPGPVVAGSGGSAGAVTLTASNGSISLVDITATGGTGIDAVGGGGGSVLLQTTGGAGTVTVGKVNTTGGTGGADFNSGNAGNIKIDTNAGALITLNGDLIAVGGAGVVQGPGGNITVQDKAVITRNTLVDTGSTSGRITFNSSVHSVSTTPYSLTTTAGTGNVLFEGELGAPITGFTNNRLLSLTASGANVTINENVSTTDNAGIVVNATGAITIGNGSPTDTVVFNTNEAVGGGATANGVVTLTSNTTNLTDNLTITRGTGAVTFANQQTLVGGNYNLTIDGTGANSNSTGNVSFQQTTSDLGDVTLSQVGILTVASSTTNSFSSNNFIYTDYGTGSATINAPVTIQTSGGTGLKITTAGAITVQDSISTPNAPITLESTGAATTLNNDYKSFTTSGTGNGAISITGVSVAQTNANHRVNAGADKILVDGNTKAINLAGYLETTYTTNPANIAGTSAVLLRDASTVQFAAVVAGNGALQVGTPGGSPDVTGDVTQNSHPSSGLGINYFAANTGANITVNAGNNNSNSINNLGTISLNGVLNIRDDGSGLNVLDNLTAQQITVRTRGGNLALGNSNVSTSTGTIFLQGQGITQGSGSTITSGTTTPSTVVLDASDFIYGQNYTAVNMAGTITTASTAAGAVTFQNATSIVLPQVNATGVGSSVQINNGNTSSGAVTQTTGKILNVATVNVNTRGSVTLDQANTITAVSGISYGGNVVVNDLGGLKLTGGIGHWNGGNNANNVTLSTTGLLDLNGQSITGSNVSLTGVSVQSTGGMVYGTGTITIDAQDGSIDLTGTSLTTGLYNGTVELLDAGGDVVIGSIATNTGGSVVLGDSSTPGDELAGNLTQKAAITTGTLTGNVGGSVTLTNGGNTLGTLGSLTAGGSISIVDSSSGINPGLTVNGTVTNANQGLVSVTTTGGGLSISGSINGSGTTLTNNNGEISLTGPINANSGTVTLTAAGGTSGISQGGSGTITTSGNLTGTSAGAVSLGLNNLIGTLGPFSVTAAGQNFTLVDSTGGLSLTGNISLNSGALSITTVGGPLAFGANSVTAVSGNYGFTFVGQGFTQSSGSLVNAISGDILFDANAGAIAMAGEVRTLSTTSTAVKIIDATTVALPSITAASGTVTIGAGDITGAVSQTSSTTIKANILTASTTNSLNLSNSTNEVATLASISTKGDFSLVDATGGLISTGNIKTTASGSAGGVSIQTTGGILNLDFYDITANGGVSLTGQGVSSSAGSVVNAGGGDILIDGKPASTAGAIALAGTLRTTSNTATAVQIVDATTLTFAGITTGTTGTTSFGTVSLPLTGAVSQTGSLVTGTLIGNSKQVTLDNGSNQLAFLGPYTVTSGGLELNDTNGTSAQGLTLSGNVVTAGTTKITSVGLVDLATYNLNAAGNTLTINGLGIVQNASSSSTISAAASFLNAGTGNIDLLSPTNEFTSTVTPTSTGSYAAIRDGSILALSQLTGNLGTNTGIKAIAGTTLSLFPENLSTGTGYIYLQALGGSITTLGTLTTSTGDISALASGQLTVIHAVTSTSPTNAGNVVLSGDSGVSLANNIAVTTDAAGTISVTSVSGSIAMSSGTSLVADTGAITLTANGNAGIATITTGGNVTITSSTDNVTDNLSSETANITANVVTITASTGIGLVSDDLETTASQLDLTATTGGIYVNNVGAVQLGNATGGVNTITSGDIAITATGAITTGSTITTGGANGTISISNTAGSITLSNAVTAHGSGDVNVTASAALAANSNVATTLGDLVLTGVGVTQATSTTINAGSGTATIDGQGSTINLGGLITSSGSGTVVTVRDASTVALGTISAANGSVAIGVNDISGAVTQNPSLLITANTLIVDTNAAVTLTNSNALTNLGAVTTSGAFSLTDAGGLTLTGASNVSGAYTITTTGVLALGANNVTATGNISFSSTGLTQASGSTVDAGSGTILVDSNAGVINLAGALATTSNSSTAVQILKGGASTNSLGTITAANGTVVIGANDTTGGYVQTAGKSITANVLVADLNSSLDLSNSGNAIGTVGAVTIDGAPFTLADSTGGLTVSGPVAVSGNVSITTTGDLLTITGNISNAGGDLVLSGKGINQTGGAITTSNGTISGNGGNVALTRSGNDFTGAVAITNTGSATTAITDANAIQFGAVSTGTGTLSATASGNITQNSKYAIITGGAVVLDSGSGAITLTGTNNDFTGAVSAKTTGGAAIALVDANAIQLGAISASGTLAATAVGITQTTDGITAVGNATLSAGAGVITLTTAGNDFKGTVALSNSGANNVSITDTNAIQFATSGVGSGTLTVTAVGITQSGAITQAASAGTAAFNGGAAAITLTNAGNDFTGPVAANNTGANAINLTDANALILGAVTTANNLTVGAGGAVTQSSAIKAGGTTTVTATGSDVSLSNTANDFSGAVSLTGKNVAVYDSTSLLLGPSTATGTFAATANTGNITQDASPALGLDVTGVATFTANGTAANILLNNPTNAFVGGVSIVAGAANNVTIVDTSIAGLLLSTIDITGNLTLQANGINQTGKVLVDGLTSLTSTGGDIQLTNAGNDFGTVAVNTTGKAAAVSLSDSTGITFVASTLGTGTFTVNAKSIGQTGAITQDASAGAVSLNALAGTLALDNTGNAFTSPVSATTADGNAISLTNSTAITLGTVTAAKGTAPAGGDITITANGVSATGGANSITTTGNILLQPLAANTTIGVASKTGSIQFDQSVFNTTITNGAKSITIGRADQSGTITVGAVTFQDPTIIRAPSGSVAVTGQITGADDASISISASPTTVSLANNIVTAGNAITIDNGSGGNTAVVLGANTVLDTTNGGAVSTGAAVTIRGTVTSAASTNRSLTITAGTTGDVFVASTIGGANALSSLTISGNDITLASIDGVAGNTSITAANGTDAGSVTFTSQTYSVTGGLSVNGGAAANPIQLTGGSSGATTTITTAAGQVAFSGALDLNARNLSIDTTNAAGSPAGSNIVFNNTVDGAGTLTLNAGSSGTVTASGALGGGTGLTGLTITQSAGTMFKAGVTASTVSVADTTGTVAFQGVLTTGSLVTASKAYAVSLLGNASTITNAVTFSNTGGVTLGDGGGDVLTFNGGITSTASPTTINGTVQTSGDAVTLGTVTLAGGSTIDTGSGTGNIQIGSVTGGSNGLTLDADAGTILVTGTVSGVGTLTVTQSGGTTFQDGVSATTVTISDTADAQTVAFQGVLTATTLTTAAQGYAVSLTGNGSTITNAVTFSNTGGVTLGDGGADALTFNGGITSTASPTTLYGTVSTPNVNAAFNGLTLAGNSVINTGTGPGDISIGSITGAGKNLQLISGSGTTTVTGAATGLAALTLQEDAVSSTGAVTFQGNLSATSLTTFAHGYSVAFEGAASTITTATNFLNTGAVALGNDSTDVTTFAGGLTTTGGPSGTTLAGTIATTNTPLSLGAVTLKNDATLVSGSGAITLASASAAGGLLLTLGNAQQVGTATISGNVTFADGLLTSAPGAFNVVLGGTTNTVAFANFSNTGSLQLGTAGGTSTFTNGLTASAPSAVNLAGVIEATNKAISLGDVTLVADTTLRAGSGKVTTQAITDGTNSFGLTLGSAAQTGDITLAGNVTIDALTTVAGAYGVALTGGSNEITQAVTMANIAFVTLGDSTNDVSLFSGGLSVSGLTGNTNLIGTISSAGAPITLDATSLTGSATVDSTNNGANLAGATITLADGLLLNGYTLTTYGGTTASTDLTGTTDINNGQLVVSTGNLNIGAGGSAGILTASQNTTLQVDNGALNVNAGSSIKASGNTLTLKSDSITISSGSGSIIATEVTLAPVTTSSDVFLGTATGTGLVISQTAFDAIDADSIVIGQTGNTGDVAMGVLSLAGTTLNIYANGSGGSVFVDGQFTSTGSTASGIALQINGSGSTTLLHAGITSDAAVVINDALELAQNNVTINTSKGNANVTISGGKAGIFATSGQINSLVIDAGTGTVSLGTTAVFGDNGSSGSLVNDVTITAGATTIGANPSEIAGTFTILAGTLTLAANLSAAEIDVASTAGVTLAADVVLAAPTAITLSGPVNGAFALTANSAGITTFGGPIGAGKTALTSLSTDKGGSTYINAGSITTTGTQTYGDAVTLLGATTLASKSSGKAGDITFSGTLDGAQALIVNTAGKTTFGNIVGGAVALTSIFTDSPGLVDINAGSITTTGSQTYNELVTLGANTELRTLSTLPGTLVTLAQVSGNTYNLKVDGNTSLTGQVSNVSDLEITGTALVAANVTTNGTQTYTGLVTLAANAALTGTTPTFTTGVTGGGNNLVLTFSGPTAIDGASFTGIKDLASNGVGTTSLTGALTTTGTQTYANPVTLLGATTTLASTGVGAAGDITFLGTLDGASTGAQALIVNTGGGGTTTFSQAVGAKTALSSIVTDVAGEVAINGGSVTTTGTQTYNELVSLGADTKLTGSTVAIGNSGSGGVNGAGKSLDVVGNAVFNGDVASLSSLSVSGTAAVNTATIDTAGAQTYTGLVTLGSPTVTLIGTNPTFSAGIAGAGKNLTLNFSGTTAIDGATFTGINNLATGNGGLTTLTGDLTTTGTQTYADAVTLLGDTTLVSTGTGAAGDIAFSGTLDGASPGAQALIVNTAGITTFSGSVGSTRELASLVTDAAGTTAIDGGAISTTGTQTYAGPVTLGANTTLTGSTITNSGTVTGNSNALTITGNAVVAGVISGVSNYAVSGTASLGADLSTTGTQTYGDAVTLVAPTVTLASTGVGAAGDITFLGTLDGASTGAQALIVNTGGGGTTTFSQAVGAKTALSSIVTDVAGEVAINGGSVTTTGTQTYNELVSLGADTKLTGSTVAIGNSGSGGVNGAGKSLDVVGNAVFNGDVASLSSLSVSGTAAVNTATIDTAGAQTYTGLVTLGSPTVTLIGTNPTFSAGIAGAGKNLTLNFSGTTAIDGATFTGINNLATGNGGLTTLTGDLTTTGTQTYADAVTLLGATTAKGSAVSFQSVTGGGNTLTVDSNALFDGTTTGLASLTVTGTTSLAGSLETTGNQIYSGLLTLNGPTSLSGDTGTFGAGVAGNGKDLVLTFTGTTAIDGSFIAINNLTSNGGGTTTLNGTIETTGTQTYTDPVTLLGDTTTKGTTVSFTNLTGASNSLNVTGNAVFAGSTSGLNNLSVSGPTSLAGSLTTIGSQTFSGALTLNGPAVLTSSSFTAGASVNAGVNALTISTDTISLAGNVTGTSTLTIQPNSPTTTMGIGDGAPGNLLLPTASLAKLQNGFSAITLGSASATGQVRVSAATFNDPITIQGAGNLQLDGLVQTGQGSQAGSITIAADTLALNAGIVTVGQTVTLNSINGDVSLGSGSIQTQGPVDSGIASGGITIAVSGSGNVNLLSTLSTAGSLNATGPGSDGGAINISTTTGSISIGSLITDGGASTAPGASGGQAGAISLNSSGSNPITFNGGTISAQGGFGFGGQPSGGSMSFGAVQLANGATLVTTGPTGGDISFTGPLNGAQDLSLSAGTGRVVLSGTIGATNSLGSLSVLSGATTINTPTINTQGIQLYNAPLTLAQNTTLTSGAAGNVTFASTVDGASALIVNTAGATTFNGVVGGNTALASIFTDGPGTVVLNGGSFTSTGNQEYNEQVTMGANTTITSGNGNIVFNNTINSGSTPRDLVIRSDSGSVILAGPTTNLRNLQIVANQANLSTQINTTSNLNINTAAPLVLGSANIGGNLIASSDGSISQSAPFNVAGSSNLSSGSGDIALNNNGNDFAGPVNAQGQNIDLADRNGLSLSTVIANANLTTRASGPLNLGNSTVYGALSATAVNAPITQVGPLYVGGTTLLNSGTGNITLMNRGNVFKVEPVTVESTGIVQIYPCSATASCPKPFIPGSEIFEVVSIIKDTSPALIQNDAVFETTPKTDATLTSIDQRLGPIWPDFTVQTQRSERYSMGQSTLQITPGKDVCLVAGGCGNQLGVPNGSIDGGPAQNLKILGVDSQTILPYFEFPLKASIPTNGQRQEEQADSKSDRTNQARLRGLARWLLSRR